MRLWTLDSGPDNIFDTLCLRVETKASECALHVSRFGDRRNPSARKGCPRHCSDQIQRFNPHLCCCWAPIAGIPGPPCGRHGWWTALESQWTRRPASNPAPRRSYFNSMFLRLGGNLSACSTRRFISVSICRSSFCKRIGSVELVATICPGKVQTALKPQALLRFPIQLVKTNSESKPKS